MAHPINEEEQLTDRLTVKENPDSVEINIDGVPDTFDIAIDFYREFPRLIIKKPRGQAQLFPDPESCPNSQFYLADANERDERISLPLANPEDKEQNEK